MKHIVIDLEMNPLAREYKEEKAISKMEIIEIGAVVLDEQYREIGAFKTLVRPQYNDVIEKRYTKLTGITTEMAANAPVFEEALHMFFSWCRSQNDALQIYQWSVSDLEQITREKKLKNISIDSKDQELLENWQDFQKEYGERLNMTQALSLKNAVMFAGIDFVGKEHDALFDARNTAALLRILRDPELCKAALEHVIEALNPNHSGTTLGEMINFEELDIIA